MAYEFLLKDLRDNPTPRNIGTDKGLSKIGDAVVNLIYSLAKSIHLTKGSGNDLIVRTGQKVSKKILARALKEAGLKDFARTRSDAHDLADTVEAIIGYVWMMQFMSIQELVEVLETNLSGGVERRVDENHNAAIAFTRLLEHVKKYLPGSKSS